ncbi:MAG: hypothetical protein IPO98_18305 [Saprospiraceae bacterium]|nr:hypothetical protein [Saprospiraceae bacterium]
MRNFFWIFIIVLNFGCKNENTDLHTALQDLKTAKVKDPKKLTIPEACQMISDAKLKEILKIKAPSVNLINATDPQSPGAKSCFFKWEDANTPNAGILIQLQTNPVFDQYEDYFSKFVVSKLSEGETTLGDEKPSVYKKFNAGGVDGVYSFQQARFYWNYGNNYLVMLAMNVTTLSENQMVSAAEEIALEINKTFVSQVNL